MINWIVFVGLAIGCDLAIVIGISLIERYAFPDRWTE